MPPDIDPALVEVRKMYFDECRDLLGESAEKLMDVSETLDKTDPEILNAIFRAVHSAKGGAGAWSLTEPASFAHSYEAVLGGVRDGSIQISKAIVTKLIEANDVLMLLLQNAEQDIPTDPADWKELAESLIALTTETTTSNKPKETNKGGQKVHPVTLHLDPILDNTNAGNVARDLLNGIDGSVNLTLYGDKVERITTLGAQVIMSASKSLADGGGGLTLKSPSAQLFNLLTSLGLSSCLKIED